MTDEIGVKIIDKLNTITYILRCIDHNTTKTTDADADADVTECGYLYSYSEIKTILYTSVMPASMYYKVLKKLKELADD
jgi:hypothetical protein